MKKLNDLLARIPEMQARAKQRAEREPLPGKPLPNNVVQLPLWPEPVRAVPNGFLRSALFGAIAKGKRRYIDGEQLAALDGIEIRYTGQRLDQGDLDVWESVLHAVRLQELGSQCRLTSYALLKLMGKTDTGKNRVTLNKRITRLVATALTVKQGRYSYIGSLIAGAAKDEETQEWVIELDAAAPAVRRRPVHADRMGRASRAEREAAGPVAARLLRQPRQAVPAQDRDAAPALRQRGGRNVEVRPDAAQGAGRRGRGQRSPRRGVRL